MLRVTLTDQPAALDVLRADWDRLLSQSSSNTVFLTWEWARAWWNSYGLGKQIYILKVEQDGELVALAPFYRSTWRAFGILRYRSLHLIGDGSWDSDYLDLIAKTGDEARAIEAVVQFLFAHQRDWDFLFLNEIPESSANLKALRDLLQSRHCSWTESEVGCTYVPLPSDWTLYVGSLKPRMRTKIRSLAARLEHSFDVRFDVCKNADELPKRFDSLFRLHGQRWNGKDQTGVFVSPLKRHFYHELAQEFLARGWLRFYSLAIDGQYVAHQYCLEYQRQLFLLQEGFDPRWEEHGVGNVLRAHVFRDCIDRKLCVYDFLGGVTAHKLSWGGTTKTSMRVTVGLPTLKTNLLRGRQWAREATRRWLKQALPKAVVEVMRKTSLGAARAG